MPSSGVLASVSLPSTHYAFEDAPHSAKQAGWKASVPNWASLDQLGTVTHIAKSYFQNMASDKSEGTDTADDAIADQDTEHNSQQDSGDKSWLRSLSQQLQCIPGSVVQSMPSLRVPKLGGLFQKNEPLLPITGRQASRPAKGRSSSFWQASSDRQCELV